MYHKWLFQGAVTLLDRATSLAAQSQAFTVVWPSRSGLALVSLEFYLTSSNQESKDVSGAARFWHAGGGFFLADPLLPGPNRRRFACNVAPHLSGSDTNLVHTGIMIVSFRSMAFMDEAIPTIRGRTGKKGGDLVIFSVQFLSATLRFMITPPPGQNLRHASISSLR